MKPPIDGTNPQSGFVPAPGRGLSALPKQRGLKPGTQHTQKSPKHLDKACWMQILRRNIDLRYRELEIKYKFNNGKSCQRYLGFVYVCYIYIYIHIHTHIYKKTNKSYLYAI